MRTKRAFALALLLGAAACGSRDGKPIQAHSAALQPLTPLFANPFTPLKSFPGIASAETVPLNTIRWQAADATGAVGPNHYFQVVNSAFRIYDKRGNPLVLNSMLGLPPPS